MEPAKWLQIKASLQEELNRILADLERAKLEPSAAKIRRVAVSPASEFGTATEWLFGVMEAADNATSAVVTIPELGERLKKIRERAHDAIYCK